jgi:hypothetical protein
MANTVVEIARSPGDLVVITAEYDASLNIRGFEIANNGGSTVTATVTKDGVQGSWQLVAGPGETASDTVPANLVSFALDDVGGVAIPHVTLGPYWVGYFDVWHWLVTVA